MSRITRVSGGMVLLAAWATAGILLASCSAPSVAEGSRSILHLDLEGDFLLAGDGAGSRTVRPSLAGVTYGVVGDGPGDAAYSGSFGSPSIELELEPGIWALDVSARDATNVVLLSGSAEVTISPYRGASATVILARPAGDGVMSLAVSFGPDVTLASSFYSALSVDPLSSADATSSVAFTLGGDMKSLSYSGAWAAGDYALTATFTNSSGVALYFLDTIQVFAGATSSASYAYDAFDFSGGDTAATGVYLSLPSQKAYYLGRGDTDTVAGSETLTATINPSNAAYTSLTWTSSDASVATVSAAGLVQAVAPGNARITATLVAPNGTFTDSCDFIISSSALGPGDKGPAGGLVYYDYGNYSTYGWRYLECAPGDLPMIQWYNGTNTSVSTSAGVNYAEANTEAIVSAYGVGPYAAYLCSTLVLGGYSDWYLPTRNDFTYLYSNLFTKGLGSLPAGTTSWDYWTSEQYGASNGYFYEISLSSGTYSYYSSYNSKDALYRVRPVRSF